MFSISIQRLVRAARGAGLGAAVLVSLSASCGESEPTSNLTDSDLEIFCPPANGWFDALDERRNTEWGSDDAGWRASHEAERDALVAVEAVMQDDWRDKFDNNLRQAFEEVVSDNDRRLEVIGAPGYRVDDLIDDDGNVNEIVQINLERNSATFNNFALEVCVNPE